MANGGEKRSSVVRMILNPRFESCTGWPSSLALFLSSVESRRRICELAANRRAPSGETARHVRGNLEGADLERRAPSAGFRAHTLPSLPQLNRTDESGLNPTLVTALEAAQVAVFRWAERNVKNLKLWILWFSAESTLILSWNFRFKILTKFQQKQSASIAHTTLKLKEWKQKVLDVIPFMYTFHSPFFLSKRCIPRNYFSRRCSHCYKI